VYLHEITSSPFCGVKRYQGVWFRVVGVESRGGRVEEVCMCVST